MMDQVFEREWIVTPSLCDAEGRLSVSDAFSVCMDIAAIHAQRLGIGLDTLAMRNLFWVTVKTQLHFNERPKMMERVTVRTWPDQPGKVRGNRSYQILRGETVLISGKTEWAVMNLQTKQFALLSDVYPADLSFDAEPSVSAPFARIPDDFADTESYERYIVSSTDIDVGGHMNNTAYVRALLGSLTNRALRDLKIGRMDVIFRSPCYEGNILEFQRHETPDGTAFRIAREGETALLAQIAEN